MKMTELLETLDKCIADNLVPFMKSNGATHLTGLSNCDVGPGPSSISPMRHSQIGSSLFWWVNRFEVGPTILDIGYGDKEAIVEPRLYFQDIKQGFAPWELLTAAADPEPHAASGEMLVQDAGFMQIVVVRLSEGIKQKWDLLSSPTPAVIDRALQLRGQRMLFDQEKQRQHDRERACAKAAEAFHGGNYHQVIQLLEPFSNDSDTPRSSRMMIELARKKAGSTNDKASTP